MALKFTTKGVSKARQVLLAFQKQKQREVKTQVAKTAYNIESRAKKNVRVDTGRLRASIHVVFSQGGYNASIGSNVEYAGSQEFGLPGRRYSYTPYLMPAFNAEREAFMQSLQAIFKK